MIKLKYLCRKMLPGTYGKTRIKVLSRKDAPLSLIRIMQIFLHLTKESGENYRSIYNQQIKFSSCFMQESFDYLSITYV